MVHDLADGFLNDFILVIAIAAMWWVSGRLGFVAEDPAFAELCADLGVTFVRPLTAETGPIRCEGRVIHAGSPFCGMTTANGRSR